MARAIEDEYLKARKLFVRILPNAFAGSKRAELFESAFSHFACETLGSSETYRTFLVDLAPSLEELRKGLDKKWRNQLSRSERNSLTVISGRGKAEYSAFCKMYFQMHERKAFETTVDVDEFGRIQDELANSQRMDVLICLENGIPVAGLVASQMGNSAIYLLGATSDAGLNAKGAYLLQWNMIGLLKENGAKSYDLGGIDPEKNPGVYHFKKGLSGQDVCHIKPLAASNSAISTAITKVGLGMQRTLHGTLKPWSHARSAMRRASIT
jgi:lipid II:glycine glycyltransferase (peptidoglycan interpeptide bridge formation enzyme)